MSSNNKKSVPAQALLEMDDVVSAIKEESKKTLSVLLNEAVKDAIRDGIEDDADYEVVDDEKNDAEGNDEAAAAAAPADAEAAPAEAGAEEAPAGDAAEQPAPAEQPAGEGEEGWDEFSQYQVGDDTYDLTGENDYDNVVKVYKLLKDEDQVVVRKEGDTIQLKDDAAGTEYVIDLGGDDEAAEVEPEGGEAPEESLNEDFDVAGFPGDESDDFEMDGEPAFNEPENDIDFDLDLDDESSLDDEIGGDEEFDDDIDDDEFDSDSLMENNNFVSKKSKKPMKESKEVLFEVDLGYTDNYQDKDPIQGLSNDEPSKSGRSWHKGVPTGTQKPWAGPSKPKGKPFQDKAVDEEEEKCCPKCGKKCDECNCECELEEGAASNSSQAARKKNKSKPSNGRKEYLPDVTKSVSTAADGYEAEKSLKESKQIKALKSELAKLRKNLNEAYITNVNLGKITRLFLENTTTKSEKMDIVNRFSNEAKTIDQSNKLYETISRELKKTDVKTMNINEAKTVNGSKEINENKGYKSDEVLKTIDLMNRMSEY